MPMRSWKSNPFVALVLLVVILLAGWLTYRIVRKPGKTAEYSYVLRCTNPECGRTFEDLYPEGREPPFTCSYCGEKTAYFLLKCRACGEEFDSLKSPSQKVPYLCPNCGKEAGFPLEPGQVRLDGVPAPQ